MTTVEKLTVLLCGYEIIPRGVSIRGGGDRFVMSLPICAYLLETREGLVVFDTGFDSSLLRDPALREEHFAQHSWEAPVVRPRHEMLTQLAEIGAAPEGVRHVILSHAHLDHTGNLKHFAHAKVWMQQAERDFAFAHPPSAGVIPRDLDKPGIDWQWVGSVSQHHVSSLSLVFATISPPERTARGTAIYSAASAFFRGVRFAFVPALPLATLAPDFAGAFDAPEPEAPPRFPSSCLR